MKVSRGNYLDLVLITGENKEKAPSRGGGTGPYLLSSITNLSKPLMHYYSGLFAGA